MTWWAWLIIAVAVWLVVLGTATAVWVGWQFHRIDREFANTKVDKPLNLGPSRRGGTYTRRDASGRGPWPHS